MATTLLARDLESLFQGGSATGLSDRQLIERFTARRDEAGEAAFAALVARHGPMVLGVCRQILGDQHQAENAFQAVFLVLADKARSLREPDLLGNWLVGVAVRTARRARLRLGRRRRAEETGSARRAAMAPAAATAASNCTASIQRQLLASISSTPKTSGARCSTSPASRPTT